MLLTAYSANPAAQSEPLNGYKFIRELSRVVETTIIAHARDRSDLERTEIARRIHYVGSRQVAGALRAITMPLFGQRWHLISTVDFIDYSLWDIECSALVRRMMRGERFDIVHRVTPTTIRFPSSVWTAAERVVSGPHNGGMCWPPGFAHLARAEGTVDQLRVGGDILHWLAQDFAHYRRILVAHEGTKRVVPSRHHSKVAEMVENGVDRVFSQSVCAGDARYLLYVGRLVPVKCVDLLIRAVARLPGSVHLTIVGDGPERPSLERLADALGVRSRVDFVGWVAQRATYGYYQKAGLFVFPSVRESGGAVVLDAMASGLPVVVARWGGPAHFIGRDAGIGLPVDSPEVLEDGIVNAVLGFLGDPASGRELGRRAQERVAAEFLWPKKAEHLLSIYGEVLNE